MLLLDKTKQKQKKDKSMYTSVSTEYGETFLFTAITQFKRLIKINNYF